MTSAFRIGDTLAPAAAFHIPQMAQGERSDWLAFAVSGREFTAMDDMAALGIDHWRGVRIEFERRGKHRTAEAYEYPFLRNYIRIRPTHQQIGLLSNVRYLGRTFMPLDRKASQQFDALAARVDEEAEAKRRASGNRKAIADFAAFKAGDEIEIREGALADAMAKFVRMIQRPHDLFPVIQAEIDVMGRKTMIDIDPLSVRKPKDA